MYFHSQQSRAQRNVRSRALLIALVAVVSLLGVSAVTAEAKKISSGGPAACAVTAANSVACWGYNQAGILGISPSTTASATPLAIAGIGGTVSAVEAGSDSACALRTNGAVRCWGGNMFGQLGDGTTTDSTSPVSPSGLGAATSISMSYDHACAVVSGTVRCWGSNDNGQLGNGTLNSSLVPVKVKSLGGTAVQVDTNSFSTCARLVGGTVKCWGYNGSGQLGNGKTATAKLPVLTKNISNATDLTSANESACATVASGAVKCWGANYAGQLGTGNTTDSLVPVPVVSLGGSATSVSMSGNQTCARLTTGSIRCWGRNESGQLGDGTLTQSLVPVTVLGLGAAASDVTAGGSYSCATLVPSGIRCWGENWGGQLGTGSTAVNLSAVQMPLPSGAAGTAPGGGHTCVAMIDGSAQCTGYNASGQLGDGTNNQTSSAVAVTGLGGAVSGVVSDSSSSCALRTDGTVKCWGYNAAGQLGNGSTTNSNVPVDVLGLGGPITQIAAKFDHSCALRNDGTVLCWGNNDYLQLGLFGDPNSTTAVAVSGLGAASKIALGSHSSCAIVGGTPYCWGFGSFGDGGLNTTYIPTPLTFLGGSVADIAMGSTHGCALITDGSVKCWGTNSSGELGDGTNNDSLSSAVTVSLGGSATAVGTTSDSSCALLADGTVKCWGGNAYGQLGDGTTTTRSTPAPVIGLPAPAASLSTNSLTGCVTTTGDSVYCWGSDFYGNHGDGQQGWSVTPLAVLGF